MKLVFQENPKFGDEQDVTQQIVAIEESIDKLLAEIKRFEVSPSFSLSNEFPSNFLHDCSLTYPKSNEHEFLRQPISISPHASKAFMILINRSIIHRWRVHLRKLEGKIHLVEVSFALLCVVH